MKALFIRCYGKLTADMMIGGLIDMGVPPVYLKSKLKEAGLPDHFIEKPNPKAQISAHYFHIPPFGEKPLLLKQADIFRLWKEITVKGAPEWEETGWKVFSRLTAGASDAVLDIPADVVDLRRVGVSEENLVSLYLFLASLDYLEVESLFTCPFSIDEGKTEAGKASAAILTDAVSTVGKDVSPEDIHPFAAAMVEGFSTFLPMDGRFLVDRSAYGSSSAEKPTGDNTMAEYLGYFTDRGESVFGRHMKVFGTDAGLDL
ncbi:nickel insertion protein [uncultured Dialister sp.]|uniref:nickel insertion protein n=1 Tax=uncultured Dialister sp. TaxID=278064 RepID=UPI0025F7BE26|nr:nickel insertion protein [uncultured Dialister sp.]